MAAFEDRAAAAASQPADEELMSLLEDAVRWGVLTAEEATLIATTTIGHAGLTQLVDSRSALRSARRRRLLAERRLAWLAI
jgi:hypothetical protein